MSPSVYKIYIYIIEMSKPYEPNFIFGDIEEERETVKNKGRLK
jgi:hypothetical protein